MPELTLIPTAVRVHFRAAEERDVPDWPAIVREFVALVAARVGPAPRQVIGHIKGMVRLPGHLLRVNCVSAAAPVEVAGGVPAEAREIVLELVLLVYGLSPQGAVEALAAAAGEVRREHGGTIFWEEPSAHHHAAPHHTGQP
jgi:hypothetical protein